MNMKKYQQNKAFTIELLELCIVAVCVYSSEIRKYIRMGLD